MSSTNPLSDRQTGKDKRLTPAELIRKHIKDPGHVVTEDELRNLRVGEYAKDKTQIDKEADAKSTTLIFHIIMFQTLTMF
jgi:hypothetical protein